jgi:hypothetical protein
MLNPANDWAASARSEGWITPYLTFTSHVQIDSKETGVGELKRYGSQKRFILEMCEGLDRGIRHFVNVKARQLGISTECLLLDLFWISVHDGLQGAIIFDNEDNLAKFRILFDRVVGSLPASYRVPIVKNNEANLVLANGSVLDYVVAGVRKKGGGLARSRAWNFVHGTEASSWGSSEGVASMMASLAQTHPHRLYIFESTARGYNLFYDMVQNARRDPFTQKVFFIGWWAKEIYRLLRGTPEFDFYWAGGDLSKEEATLCEHVKKQYHFTVDPEQIAWYRWMSRVKIADDDLMAQEYPWTEKQAFISSGKSFFNTQRVEDGIEAIREQRVPFKGFSYNIGENFLETSIDQVERVADAELRMWEDPQPNGVYCIGCDPGFGRADKEGDHCIEVYRCYADRADQVAEYWTDEPETFQVAWVLAHLAGSYRNVWINVEVNGPGPAVMKELAHLKQLMDSGYLRERANEKGLTDVFQLVRWYLYHRPDTMGAGYAYGWKSNPDLDLMIMNQMRDGYALRALQVRSVPLLEEMRSIVQDGGDIKAEREAGDGRVHATALAYKAYIEWVRPAMIAAGRTHQVVVAEERLARERPDAVFHNLIVQDFFKQKADQRLQEQIEAAWR